MFQWKGKDEEKREGKIWKKKEKDFLKIFRVCCCVERIRKRAKDEKDEKERKVKKICVCEREKERENVCVYVWVSEEEKEMWRERYDMKLMP